ncbi:MAG: cytochrome c [Acidimicrobiia bacterium]|nr:cytochrome c [Acidimicrobiia bacterium]
MRLALSLLLVGLLLLAGCAAAEDDLYGKDLYDRSCAACHGIDGTGAISDGIGTGTNTDLNLTDDQIAGVIVVGPGNMPGFPRFSPEQVESLVDYVRSLAE